jgi:hypothetical protein
MNGLTKYQVIAYYFTQPPLAARTEPQLACVSHAKFGAKKSMTRGTGFVSAAHPIVEEKVGPAARPLTYFRVSDTYDFRRDIPDV